MERQLQKVPSQEESGSYLFKDEAIPLITVDRDKRFTVSQEALQILRNLTTDQPLAIVSVAGMYRTGKSYLLNRVLLDRSDGFGVGPSINPCTKGLWIWGRPVKGTTNDGTPVQVLIIDTEGLGAFDETQNHDIRVFSLALLLSSSFVYNSMGTIDENAIQQLSLVVNLTNHIQTKSQRNSEAELASEFPSFLWIVRDFVLRLEDQNQQPITEREYFERSLVEIKGESEATKAKNQIRAHIKKYFTNRDCCTMVRPLANEKQLQNLARLDLEDLRPEFLGQLKDVRQKILYRIKTKTLNGRELTGPMVAQLACTYVEAINSGQMPNIEHAWNFISKQECQKALEQSLLNFEAHLSRAILPLSDQICQTLLDETMQAVQKEFQLQVRGMEIQDYLKKLESEIQKIARQFKEQNLNRFKKEFEAFAQEKAQKIKDALHQASVESFNELEGLIDQLKRTLQKEAPDGPGSERDISIERFIQKTTTSSCQNFMAHLTSMHKLNSQKAQATIDALQEEKRELVIQEKESRERLQARIDQLSSDLIISTTKQSIITGQFEAYCLEQEQLLRNNAAHFQEVTDSLREVAETLNSKLNDKEYLLVEAQKNYQALRSEHDMTLALNAQKFKFLEQQIAQKSSEVKDLTAEQQALLQKHQETIRELFHDYERKINLIQTQKEDAEEKLQDTMAQLASSGQMLSEQQAAWLVKEKLLNTEVGNLKSELMHSVDQAEVDRKQEQLNQLQQSFDELKQSIKVHITQHAAELMRTTAERDSSVTRFEKEIAILRQSIEFKDATIRELSRFMEDKSRTVNRQEKQIEEIQAQLVAQELQSAKQIEEIRREEASDKMRIKGEIDELKAQARLDHQANMQQLDDTRTEAFQQLNKRQIEISQLQQSIDALSRDKQRLEDQLKHQAERRQKEISDLTAESESKLAELAKELQDVSESNELQIQRLRLSAEESLGQLRKFFDNEKERILARSASEKNALKKQLSEFQAESACRLDQEIQRREDYINQLQENLQASQLVLQQTQNRFDHYVASQAQKLEALNGQLKERETRIQLVHESFEQTRTELEERQRQEICQWEDKTDKLRLEITHKTKEFAQMACQVKTLEELLLTQKQVSQQQTDELAATKSEFESRLAAMRVTAQEQEEASMNSKLEWSREIALLNQKNCFLEQTVEQLKEQLTIQSTKFEDQVQSLKQQAIKAYEEQTVRSADQKRTIERKHEEKMRKLKELSLNQKKQINQLETELCLAEERLANEQMINHSQLERVAFEVSQLKQQQTVDQEILSDEKSTLLSELEELRSKVFETEKTNIDLQSQIERERMLHEGKTQFLEQQRDTAKQDLNESLRKFELTVDQMRRVAQSELQRSESEQASIRSNIEKQLKSSQEKVVELTAELDSMCQKLQQAEVTAGAATAKLLAIEREQLSQQRATDRKTNELTDRETQLQLELQTITERYEARLQEAQAQLVNEKDQSRKRLIETEQRSRELEMRRATLLFDFEKERCQNNSETDRIKAKNSEIQDLLEKLERKNGSLQRELDKLRNSQKLNNQIVSPSGSFTQRSLLKPSASTGFLTSRTEMPRSTIKMQFGNRLSMAHTKAFKENETSDKSVNISSVADEKKGVERLQMRSSLLNVTAPFKQKQENAVVGVHQVRPALIKKLNLHPSVLQKREELTDSQNHIM